MKTVAELIDKLKQLDPNEKIIVSVKEKNNNPSDIDLPIITPYHKGPIKDISFHMDGQGNNAYVIEADDSFTEYIRT